MDSTEDLSARILLKNVLHTELPRTPVTRSSSQTQSSSSGTRRSDRLSRKDAGAQTPQQILRRSLKHKIRESASRISLPQSKRRTISVVSRKTNTPAPATASLLCDDGVTPRHLLRNILRTEPETSLLVQEKVVSKKPHLPSANSSMSSNSSSAGLSGLDLPDVTVANPASTVKGLSRKRPRRSLNVTAFEKRLKHGNDVEKEGEESADDLSSLSSSLSSSATLSLKTPFMDIRTEKRGLQRRVPNRRIIGVEEFGAGVHKRQMGHDPGAVEQVHNMTAQSEGFTLHLSNLSEPDITTDIINHNTALYAQPDAMHSNFSIVAMHDKPTVMASQIQRDMREVEEVEQRQLVREESAAGFPTEEEPVAESQSEEEEPAAESQSEKEEPAADSQIDEEGAAAKSQSEEEEGAAESQTDEEDTATKSQSEEEEGAAESQTEEEDAAAKSQSEEEEGAAESQTDEEDAAANSQSEEQEGATESQTDEEDAAAKSQSEEEEGVAESQIEEDAVATEPQTEELVESQTEEEDDGKQEAEDVEQPHDAEHISRRAHRSEAGLIMPATGPRATEADSKRHSDGDFHTSLDMGISESSPPEVGIPDSASSSPQGNVQEDASRAEASPGIEKENSILLLADDAEDSVHLGGTSPEQDAAQGPADQEEEWEDEGDSDQSEELSMKTPAFVREKSAATEGLAPAKPKRVTAVKTRPAKKEPGLPKSYLMGVFKHFAKTKVSPDVYPVLKEIMDKFFDRLAEDLEAYATHAKRKTIDVEDVELLLKRQGYVNDKVPVQVLIEKYLPMEYRKLLIPIATSGNVVIPKQRR
ncbi:centromere protein T isoform X2 [Centroberyx affinis]|uniref:centromere protein T isoform X2 n=1 Tax=Centroberyx affinis TaxID=166261 RepID=UPI003A5C58A5